MTITEHSPAAATAVRVQSNWYATGGKRVVDLVIAIPLLILATPILVVAAVALRIQLGPGVLLRQERVGRHGELFAMYKFRTMEHTRRTNPPENWTSPDRRNGHKSASDPRHTGLGRLLRKFSVDELPQLLNVLRGDMSLVGPRPQLAAVASPSFRAHVRHQIRPGLTGPFQVSPLRSGGSLDAGLAIDADYVENLSLRSDLAFLFGTVHALVGGTGN